MKINFSYCNLLDGLRGFAILAVLYAHSSSAALIMSKLNLGNGGFIGVDIFFVLSSFLISTLLLKEYLTFGRISVKKFYIRRFIRLSPPLLTALVAFIPILFFIDRRAALNDLFYTLTYSANFVRSFQRFISPSFYPQSFSHTWSLATEEQFYLIFPFIFLYLLKKKLKIFANGYFLMISLGSIFITAPILKPVLGDGIYDFPLWRTGEFSIGLLTALIYANISWAEAITAKTPFLAIPAHRINKIIALIKSARLSFLAIGLLFCLIVFLHLNSWPALIFGHLLASIASSFLILQSTTLPSKIVERFLGSKILVKTGMISYGLYIYHYPILNIKNWLFAEKIKLDEIIALPRPLSTFLIIIIHDGLLLISTLLISCASYKYIEKPIMKYKSRFARHN
jgi:peptidoglycan/LPS O-acetylase OafA/YrhL